RTIRRIAGLAQDARGRRHANQGRRHGSRWPERNMQTVPPCAPGRSRPKTARPRWARPLWLCPGMGARFFYGWKVVGATFFMALFSFGLGFYGLTLYVATLQRLHGWSAATVSAPVTVYYLCGALL